MGGKSGKKRVLFLDRDGTILVEPKDTFQVDSLDRFEFLPGVIGALSRIARSGRFELVLVTNQDGLGTESFPEADFWPPQDLMTKTLLGEGVEFCEVVIDRTRPEENAPTRKPGTALLGRYLTGEYDLANSYVIGDRESDVQLARNLNAKAILIGERGPEDAVLITTEWGEIERALLAPERQATVKRETKETAIEVCVALDGEGRSEVSTGLHFFDHMLDQLARHSGMDLTVVARGDLHVDEHHTVEDTAIALGECLALACGEKRGIERFAFMAPLDEALSHVVLDLSGRAHLSWEVEFRRERMGDVPTELFKHFFASLASAARFTLHVRTSGENEHHKIESIFKAFARALGQAVAPSSRGGGVPSTKGVI